MEQIFQDQMQEEKGMGTNPYGVGVQILIRRKKPKYQAAVKDWTCACGSNTHMQRSSRKYPQRHWSPKQFDDSIVQKSFHQNFKFVQKMNLKVRIMKLLRQCCTVIYTIQCHNTPGDNDIGSYENNLPYYGEGSPEEWIVWKDILLKALDG